MESGMKFLGYDPGGIGTHGCAAITISQAGEIDAEPKCYIAETASDAWDWLDEHSDAEALGIDTLMAWSLSGSRACDNALRRRYREHTRSIIPQNALYSSMTLNGAMVAKRASLRGMPLFESHPKLLIRVLPSVDVASKSIAHWYSWIKRGNHDAAKNDKQADDIADSVVAAWCAAQGYTQRWTINLFETPGDDLDRIEATAKYPWFEAL